MGGPGDESGAVSRVRPRVAGPRGDASRNAAPRESQIQAAILARLGTRADVRLWRTGVGRGVTFDGRRAFAFGMPGLADLSGILKGGYAVFIEVKRPGQALRREQAAFAAMMHAFGACHVVATSADEAEAGVEGFLAARR